MTDEITNMQNIIDSRDIIARIEELESRKAEGETLDDDEAHELEKLAELASEVEPYAPDWRYGSGLIRDSYFTEYAQELAEDLGAVNRDMSWPYTCIDWDAAADELKQDYTSVDFNGVEYWIR
jgi:hypothetical protein